MSVQVYPLLGQTERERKIFFKWVEEEGPHREITPKTTWLLREMKNVSPFRKFKKILPLLCCLLDPLQISTAVHGFYDKFEDRFQGLPKESSGNQGEGLLL